VEQLSLDPDPPADNIAPMHGRTRRVLLVGAILVLVSGVSGDHLTSPEPHAASAAHLPWLVPPAARLLAAAAAGDDLATAIQPSCDLQPRWDYIVIHHSATPRGSASAFHEDHLHDRGWNNGLGYHFVIGNGQGSPDGAVEAGPRWLQQMTGAHCSTTDNRYNEHGIGICLVGNFEVDHPTAAQLDTLERLVRLLCWACNITLEDVRVHGDLKSTLCPGKNFSLQDFMARLEDEETHSAEY
jgi:hypothetical protein